MPTDVPDRTEAALREPAARAALLTDALASGDALIVSRALRDIAAACNQSYADSDDPALSIVLAAIEALDLDLTAQPRA